MSTDYIIPMMYLGVLIVTVNADCCRETERFSSKQHTVEISLTHHKHLIKLHGERKKQQNYTTYSERISHTEPL